MTCADSQTTTYPAGNTPGDAFAIGDFPPWTCCRRPSFLSGRRLGGPERRVQLAQHGRPRRTEVLRATPSPPPPPLTAKPPGCSSCVRLSGQPRRRPQRKENGLQQQHIPLETRRVIGDFPPWTCCWPSSFLCGRRLGGPERRMQLAQHGRPRRTEVLRATPSPPPSP